MTLCRMTPGPSESQKASCPSPRTCDAGTGLLRKGSESSAGPPVLALAMNGDWGDSGTVVPGRLGFQKGQLVSPGVLEAECLCPPNYLAKPESQYDGLRRWGLWEVIGREGVASIMALESFLSLLSAM